VRDIFVALGGNAEVFCLFKLNAQLKDPEGLVDN
jgi:hypothetical protein